MIFTSISGSTSRLTLTIEAAGRIVPKNSPCARPIFSRYGLPECAYARHVGPRAAGTQRGFDHPQGLISLA
ncbi:MAG: hypothetical protein K6U02_09830 [Firmicutes bacterium]|nr:hypothetical protein [Bacillota bacterium]